MLTEPQLFATVKAIHLSTAFLSISGFLLRYTWMLLDSPRLQARLTRTLPHINDTILLISAIACATLLDQYPFVDAWLTAKLGALLIYIGCGAVALTYGRTKQTRIGAGLVALGSVGYIVIVALTKNPLPF